MIHLARFSASGAREQRRRGGFCPLEALERRRVFVHWGCQRGGGFLSTGGAREEEVGKHSCPEFDSPPREEEV